MKATDLLKRQHREAYEEHHVEEEEKALFKLANQLGAERLTELGAEMKDAFAVEVAKH